MMTERVCATPGCGKPLRKTNHSGRCAKHFYHSKMKHPPNGKRPGPSLVKPRTEQPGVSRVPVYLDEEQLNRFIVKMEMPEKAKLVNAFLAGAI